MTLPINQSGNFEKITIKKSTFNALVIGLVIAIAITTFVLGVMAGNSFSEKNSDFVTKSNLDDSIAILEKKIDGLPSAIPTAQIAPTTQPSEQDDSDILLVSLDDDPIKGDIDAPITIVEFSDFQCPFCGRWYTNTLSELTENYLDTGKVKLVYRDMPLSTIHPNAQAAHIAAECADEQGKFWDYHDVLFERQSEWNRLSADNFSVKLDEFANSLKLDISSFKSCMSSSEIANEIISDGIEARTYGATGTPTFFVGNQEIGFVKLVGAQPYSTFKTLIDNQLD